MGVIVTVPFGFSSSFLTFSLFINHSFGYFRGTFRQWKEGGHSFTNVCFFGGGNRKLENQGIEYPPFNRSFRGPSGIRSERRTPSANKSRCHVRRSFGYNPRVLPVSGRCVFLCRDTHGKDCNSGGYGLFSEPCLPTTSNHENTR